MSATGQRSTSSSPPLALDVNFHRQAALTPDRPAVIDDEDTLTYAELELRVLALAEVLRSEFDVGPDVVVGVLLAPSIASVVAYLAILSAGGAFLPIELAYPTAMVDAVCEDAKPAVVLTSVARASAAIGGVAAYAANASTPSYAAAEALGRTELLQRRVAERKYGGGATLDDLAFVVYTSGTTGKPKGILNPHRAPALSYAWRFTIDPIGPGSVVACNVFFIWECLRPLLRGACTYCIPSDIIYDGPALAMRLERHAVSEILFTPTLFSNFMATTTPSMRAAAASTLRTVHLNGEVVTVDLARRALLAFPDVTFFNLYSISECHEVTCADLRECITEGAAAGVAFCPVGFPSAIVNASIRDENGHLVAEGEQGELFIGGELLARGYLKRPALTEERFPTLEDGTRAYRTGDRVRKLASGMLLHLGRCDSMVKIRGYSVVLGKIEHVLLAALHGLDSCAVIADGEEGTEKRLVAFLVKVKPTPQGGGGGGGGSSPPSSAGNDGGEGTTLAAWTVESGTGHCVAIQRAVRDRLAHYMVPTVFIEIDALPLHPVGKRNDGELKRLARAQRAASSSAEAIITTYSARGSRAGSDSAPSVVAQKPSSTLALRFLSVARGSDASEVLECLLLVWDGVLALPSGTASKDSVFVELGGHSLTAGRMVSAIGRTFQVKLPVSSLLQHDATPASQTTEICAAWAAAVVTTPTACGATLGAAFGPDTATAAARPSQLVATAASPPVTAAEKATIVAAVRAAAMLPATFVARSGERLAMASSPRALTECSHILLTGATGYLGAHLLSEILQSCRDDVVVTCLVRSSRGLAAVVDNLAKYDLAPPRPRRVRAVVGDLSVPRFGLDESTWTTLACAVDGVVHSAAAVKLGGSFEELRGANVDGTREALAFALSLDAADSPFVYISTNGIFPLRSSSSASAAAASTPRVWSEACETTELVELLPATDGYGLSKWAAESLVRSAHDRCALPVVVVRLGNLGPSTVGLSDDFPERDGESTSPALGNALDFQSMLLAGVCRSGVAPTHDGAFLEMTPVNYAAAAVVRVAALAGCVSQGRIFHISSPSPAPTWSCALDWIDEEVEGGDGGETTALLERVSWDEFCSVVQDASAATSATPEEISLAVLVETLPGGASYLATQPILDCTAFDAAAGFVGLPPRPRLDRGTVARYVSANPRAKTARKLGDPRRQSRYLAPVGPLAGKVAIVTGASSGIGRGIALALADAGCAVVLAARRIAALEETQALIAARSPLVRTLCVRCDVTDLDSVNALVRTATRDLGAPVDILVNNAGVMYFTLMANVKMQEWRRTVEVNCIGTMQCIGAVLPDMLARGSGHIINITSDAGRKAFAGLAVYSGSKFFIEAMSQALRLETASTGLRVTCVQPGNVATPLLATSTDTEGIATYGAPSGAKVLEPADIGRAVVYAATQPEWVAVNEILVEPREEPA